VFASEIAVGGVKWKDGEARFDVLVNLKNSGHSPGLSVDVTSVACPSWNLSQLLKKQQELSERERHHPSKIGTMVFPGDAVSIKANIGLSRDDIVTFQQAIRQIDTDNHIEPVSVTSVPIGILIVIDCRLADKNEHHPNWIRDEPVLS
jgi:hypothetical protein